MSVGSLRRTSLGQYRLVDFVGAGGMGEVYRATHVATGRVVALKVLTAGGQGSAAMLERFRNEARIHATLQHPGVATMHEFFEADGFPCIAMDFVDGVTIEHLLRSRGPFAPDAALRIFAAVVDVVGYLHERGVVHRDLKSNNVKITDDGVVKLLDFGIAKTHGSPKLTTDGNVIGTLHYLSPEQLRTGQAERRSDLWALGVLLYEMLTGEMPFAGGALGVVTERLLKGVYTPASQLQPGVPRELDRVIARCLRVAVNDRYASAEALLTDVRLLMPGPVPKPASPMLSRSGEWVLQMRRRGPLTASLIAAGVSLVFLVWTLTAPGPERNTGDSTIVMLPPPPETLAPVARGAVGEGPLPDGPRPGEQRRQAWAPTADALAPQPTEMLLGNGERQTALLTVPGDLVATVWHQGRMVGRTPFRVQAPVGTEVILLLRRTGYEDEEVRFTVTELPQEYQHVLRPRVAPDSHPQPPSAPSLLSASPSPRFERAVDA